MNGPNLYPQSEIHLALHDQRIDPLRDDIPQPDLDTGKPLAKSLQYGGQYAGTQRWQGGDGDYAATRSGNVSGGVNNVVQIQ
ncbi:hypothetical protein D3C73_659130 [compost metagenome]